MTAGNEPLNWLIATAARKVTIPPTMIADHATKAMNEKSERAAE